LRKNRRTWINVLGYFHYLTIFVGKRYADKRCPRERGTIPVLALIVVLR